MKKISLFLLLAFLSLVFAPVAFAQDEEPTPPPVEDEVETESVGEGAVVITPYVEEVDEEPGIVLPDQNTITEAALLLFGAAIAISQFVDQLKLRGKIDKGQAGKWSKYTGLAISVLSALLAENASPEIVESAREYAVLLSGVLVTAYVFAGSSKVTYWLGKKIGANARHPEQKGQPVG
jgi:hypothetical protein